MSTKRRNLSTKVAQILSGDLDPKELEDFDENTIPGEDVDDEVYEGEDGSEDEDVDSEDEEEEEDDENVANGESKKVYKYDRAGLKEKLDELCTATEKHWVERLEVTVEKEEIEDIHDDFARETSFYNQALAGALQGQKHLEKYGVPHRRPADYYAEMVKTDAHMHKVRANLAAEKERVERSEKVAQIRKMKKFGKQVQIQVQKDRAAEKRKNEDEVKRFMQNKRAAGALDISGGDDFNVRAENEDERPTSAGGKKNAKRLAKDRKYGGGNKRKKFTQNTQESFAAGNDFNMGRNKALPRFMSRNKGGSKKGGAAAKRPGKARRQAMRNK
eukprot:Clim_evm37s2 gene=Clim_evmTU37s2